MPKQIRVVLTSRKGLKTVTCKFNFWLPAYNGARLAQSLHNGNIMDFAVYHAFNVKLGLRVFVGERHNMSKVVLTWLTWKQFWITK